MNWLKYVDPGLTDLLKDLNNAGFATASSCSGHLHPTGRVTPAVIELERGAITSQQDIEEVRNIIESHTDVPFRVHKGIRRRGWVEFTKPISPNLIPSTAEASDILRAIRTGKGGLGREPEKLLSMYSVEELEKLARKHREGQEEFDKERHSKL